MLKSAIERYKKLSFTKVMATQKGYDSDSTVKSDKSINDDIMFEEAKSEVKNNLVSFQHRQSLILVKQTSIKKDIGRERQVFLFIL